MAMMAVLFGGVTGMFAFLVSVLLLGFPFLVAVKLYFATGVVTLLLVLLWRGLAMLRDRLNGQGALPIHPNVKTRR